MTSPWQLSPHHLLVGTYQEVWHDYVSSPCPRGNAPHWHRLDGSAECGTDSPVGNPLLHSRFFSHGSWMDGNCDCVNGHLWMHCENCSGSLNQQEITFFFNRVFILNWTLKAFSGSSLAGQNFWHTWLNLFHVFFILFLSPD